MFLALVIVRAVLREAKQVGSNLREKQPPGGTVLKIDAPGKEHLTGGGLFFPRKIPIPRGKNPV